jgi:hypothetical protein
MHPSNKDLSSLYSFSSLLKLSKMRGISILSPDLKQFNKEMSSSSSEYDMITIIAACIGEGLNVGKVAFIFTYGQC